MKAIIFMIDLKHDEELIEDTKNAIDDLNKQWDSLFWEEIPIIIFAKINSDSDQALNNLIEFCNGHKISFIPVSDDLDERGVTEIKMLFEEIVEKECNKTSKILFIFRLQHTKKCENREYLFI
jgi:2-hydroxy-3-keto-5-methylthiopentenyl-1-phosphate phosphatase